MDILELRGVTKRFRSPGGEIVEAVRNVDLAIAKGETVSLLGPSGCGKTTVLRMVNRLVEPTEGTVLVEGQDVRSVDVVALRRRLGYVVQSGGLFPHLSVAQNVGLLPKLCKWSSERTKERVETLLELVGLEPSRFAGRYPRELSGGQQQRVGVARALALDPPIVLMDEPFGALDPITRRQIQQEFKQLRALVSKTILMVTHDVDEAFLLGDRIAVMRQGALVQVGTSEELTAETAHQFVRGFLSRPSGVGDSTV